ncbi:heparinase II/III family protein [Cellulomonas sp. zg-ZUI199]|uniref:heparinase II/III domain-containing protein n=1 Tax=Cellulomonas wangleii TaxID=2816956 RepID=UPI001A93C3FE|nr:heparinase II/III family protein [Cellulomonas wangleii]MBO0924929.1 heparinase II/III family protein [Cellulomonas wangleii]MBO0926809.1 heparinase II/III family protein [Cellulomonas wangleii]
MAARQSFGPHFERRATDARAVELLAHRRIQLHPHAEWQLPTVMTWTEDPFTSRNWAAQLHMLRWLEPARRAALAGDETARDLWVEHARSWVEHNPPGGSPSAWAWSDMVDAVRGFVLVAGLLVVDDPGWVFDSLHQHGEWLEDERHLGRANHALHQHEALFVIGTVLGQGQWVALGRTRLEGLLEESYDEQGVNAEGSPVYHDLNYRWWSRALRRLELEGEPPLPHSERLAAAPLALAHATRPDGEYESIGDGDGGRPRGIDHPATKYVASNGADGEPPADLVAVFDRGYVFGRSGWGETDRRCVDETFYSLSFGSARRVHGHPDGGSLTYFAGGRPWLVDPGKYIYGEHAIRDLVLSRASHNVVHVPGRRYDRSSVVALVARATTADTDHFVLEDRGYTGVLLRRSVTFDRRTEALVVVDHVEADDEVEAQQRWLLAPDVDVTQEDDDCLALTSAHKSTRMHLLPGGDVLLVRGRTDPHEGWKATGWGKAEPATQVSVSRRGRRLAFAAVLVPPALASAAIEGLDEATLDAPGGLRLDLGGRAVVTTPPSRPERDAGAGAGRADPDVTPGASERLALGSEVWPAMAEAKGRAWSATADQSVRLHAADDLRRRFGSLLLHDRDLGMRAVIADLTTAPPDDESWGRPPLVAWSSGEARRVRDMPLSSYKGVPHSFVPPQEPTIVTLDLGALTLPTLYSPGDSPVLTVLLHGALDRAKTALPRFERVRTHTASGGPLLAIGDPTLDLDRTLRLGWYLGTESLDLPITLAAWVRNVAEGCGARDIVLAGGSGGGFAAIHVASLLEGSTVFAVNPQTDLNGYFPRLVRPALDAVFGTRSAPRQRTAVLERMRANDASFRLFYVQNTGDRVHVERHRDPFLRGLREHSPSVDVRSVEIDCGPGHVGPKPAEYARLWRECLDMLDSSL